MKEWDSFTKEHPGQILCLFYEDMKEVQIYVVYDFLHLDIANISGAHQDT